MIRTQGRGLVRGHDSCQVQGHLLRSVPVRELCLQPKEAEAQRCQGICPGHGRSRLAGVSANHILRLQREPHQVQNGNQVLRRDAWFREDFKLEDNVMWLPQELPRNFSYREEPLPVPGQGQPSCAVSAPLPPGFPARPRLQGRTQFRVLGFKKPVGKAGGPVLARSQHPDPKKRAGMGYLACPWHWRP